MKNNLIKAKTFGSLDHDMYFNTDVSISFDTLEHSKTSNIKVLVQIEPPEIQDQKKIFIENHKIFDLILTWDEDILDSCDNAKKFIFGTCWIDFDSFKPNKRNKISFILSNKNYAPGHILRHGVWGYLSNKTSINNFELLKIMTPPRIESKNILFEDSKYHIVIENCSRKNWVTEKLIDCLSTKTIPIYWGCSNIGEIFNEKGIIKFKNIDELNFILETLDMDFYEKSINVIEENYEKSKEYFDFYGRITNEINKYILKK